MSISNKQPTFMKGNFSKGLQPQVAFDAWVETGSTTKAAGYLTTSGMKNRRGNNITPMNVWYAAWRWIIYNPDDAKPYFDADQEIAGKALLTQEEWDLVLVRKATVILRQKRDALEQWLVDTGYLEQYPDAYRYKYPEIYRKHFEEVPA